MDMFLGVVTVLLTLVTILQTYRAHRFSQLVAAHQGVFRKPHLVIRLYDSKPSKPDYFILACRIRQGKILQLPLLLALKNQGDKSVDNVKLLLRYHNRLRAGGLQAVGLKYEGPKALKPELFEDANFQTSLFDLGTVTPKQDILISDYFTIAEATVIDLNVDAVTKNGVSIILPIHIAAFNVIDYTVYQDDADPISGRIKIAVIETDQKPLQESLSVLNQLRQKRYESQIGGRMRQILHWLGLKLSGKRTDQDALLISYEESDVVRRSDLAIDVVPRESLRFYSGFEDITGAIYIPSINC